MAPILLLGVGRSAKKGQKGSPSRGSHPRTYVESRAYTNKRFVSPSPPMEESPLPLKALKQQKG